ncbi:MAG: AMP-binding protein [Desulfobacterota bacterium]|nr:AMP-binding protein [Thermodesulfobacteriota bacterium]
MNLYSWLQEHAKERPGKVAIRFRDQSITFGELYRLTDSLGTALRKAGIGRDDHVTLVLPNMPEFVITYMATMGIGAVVTTVNPAYTSRELRHILSDSESRVLIMEEGNRDTYDAIASECPQDVFITVGKEGDFPRWVSGSGSGIVEDREKDDVAAIIYSSGLTGYPMGAQLTQANLDHNSDLLRSCMEADDTDTTLTLIPCFHSFSASCNMLSMLRYGGTIYLMKKIDFKELRTAIAEAGISAICAVPTLFFGLIHHPELQDIDYTGMRALVAGGSALPLEVYDAFRQKFHADIRQGYGITEASPVCSVNQKHRTIKPASIGQTVPGVTARVEDDDGTILGPGQTGELLFKGPNIMKGYYNRPRETSDIIKDGWLHTGDLGYMDDEGYIYITGYKKDMVITSGFNVYTREVTNVLNSLPGIRDSAIIGEPDLMRGAIIKAFVVSDSPHLTEDDVKKFARKQLANFKTPRKVVFVPEIPRDDKGKVLFDLIKDAP